MATYSSPTDGNLLISASPTFDFHTTLRNPELIEDWNAREAEKVTEDDSDCDGQVGLLDVVFVPKEDFDDAYSHTDGLGSLPKITQKPIRSSAPPPPLEARLAGKAEDNLRKALRCERTRLLVTVAHENERTEKIALKFFPDWETLVSYKLPSADNLVEEVEKETQQRWNDAKLEVNVAGTGGALEGWFGIMRSWCTPTDWRSLYRARGPTIKASPGYDLSREEDVETLNCIESQLLDTTKYSGDSAFMTIITYGDDKYGTVSLFRATLQPGQDALAGQMVQLAHADRVPKQILKDLRTKSRIEYVQKDGKIQCIGQGGQHMPSLARVTTRTVNRRGNENAVLWEDLGENWRAALGVASVKNEDDNGLIATIPQMMTLLHLKGYGLHKLCSTPVQEFKEPLKSVPYDDGPRVLPCEIANPKWEIKRGITIAKGHERCGHPGRRVKVITMFPQDSAWAKEMLLWA